MPRDLDHFNAMLILSFNKSIQPNTNEIELNETKLYMTNFCFVLNIFTNILAVQGVTARKFAGIFDFFDFMFLSLGCNRRQFCKLCKNFTNILEFLHWQVGICNRWF